MVKVRGRDNGNKKLSCFTCGQKEHKAMEFNSAQGEQWCSFCKSSTHKNVNCRRIKWDKFKQAMDEESHTIAFKVGQVGVVLVSGVKEKGLMVDTEATSHIRDIAQFKEFDNSFEPHKHVLQLADGKRTSGITLKKGTVQVHLRGNKGQVVETTLTGALYVPSFPQDIFSVKAATSQGATFSFSKKVRTDSFTRTFDIQVYFLFLHCCWVL